MTQQYQVGLNDTFQTFVNRYNDAVLSIPINSIQLNLDMTGNTDMTTLLQNTLNSLSSDANVQTILLSPGTVKLSGTLTIPSNVSIIGTNTTIQSSANPVFSVYGDNCALSYMTINSSENTKYSISVVGKQCTISNIVVNSTNAISFTTSGASGTNYSVFNFVNNCIFNGSLNVDKSIAHTTFVSSEFNGSCSVDGYNMGFYGCYFTSSVTFGADSQYCRMNSFLGTSATVTDNGSKNSATVQPPGQPNGTAILDVNGQVPEAEINHTFTQNITVPSVLTTGTVAYTATNNASNPANQTKPAVAFINGEPYFWNTNTSTWVPFRSYAN